MGPVNLHTCHKDGPQGSYIFNLIIDLRSCKPGASRVRSASRDGVRAGWRKASPLGGSALVSRLILQQAVPGLGAAALGALHGQLRAGGGAVVAVP